MFKINVSNKDGNTHKLEAEAVSLIGKKLHDKVNGSDVSADFEGYELEITGASDNSGFTAHEDFDGTTLRRALLTYGKGMKKRPKREGKKKRSNKTPKGLRLRKTVRGNEISDAIAQINLKVLKEGKKKFEDIFKKKEKEKKA